MDTLNLTTKLGPETLAPGETFQTVNENGRIHKYLYIGCVDDIGKANIYLRDETNGSFCEVSREWFVNRTIRKIEVK